MNKIKFILFTILSILVFMQGFVVPIERLNMTWAFVISIIFVCVYILLYTKLFFKDLLFLYKYTPAKYLVFFYIWLLFCLVLFVLLGKLSIFKMIYFALRFFLLTAVFYILPICIKKFLSLNSIIKIFITIIFVIYAIALFQYFGELFQIPFTRDIINTFSNFKFSTDGLNDMVDRFTGRMRIRGFFSEPKGLAACICILLPIIYSYMQNKYVLFKNVFINKITKITIMPLAWFCIILSKSPIYLIFSIVITALYLNKKILKNIKRIKVMFIPIALFSTVLIMLAFDYEFILSIIDNSFLSRISKALIIFKDFDEFVAKEPSLAARIALKFNQTLLFTHFPITGTGVYCSKFYMYNQLLQSPVPLTTEIQTSMVLYGGTSIGVAGNAGCLISSLLVESGIIGTIIYFVFLITNIKFLKEMLKYTTGNIYMFLNGLYYTLCAMIVLSIYYNPREIAYIYFIYGLVGLFCYEYIKNYKKERMKK